MFYSNYDHIALLKSAAYFMLSETKAHKNISLDFSPYIH